MSVLSIAAPMVLEVCTGARSAFADDLYHSALFKLPASATEQIIELAATGELRQLLARCGDGSNLPFARTGTQNDMSLAGRKYDTSAVFSSPSLGVMQASVRLKFEHVQAYGLYRSERNAMYRVATSPAFEQAALDDMDKTALVVLRQYLWLHKALSSVHYTAIEKRISRQESRATGMPRMSWTIDVRSPRSTAPSTRQQFFEVIKAAHAVRGHLRTDFRTGDKSIRVRPHIRGRGDAIQLKDYLVRVDDVRAKENL